MSDDIQVQFQSYAETKRKEYISKKQPIVVQQSEAAVSEHSRLIEGGSNTSQRSDNCYCVRERMTQCCQSCHFTQDSIEVFKLPLTSTGVPLRIHYLWPVFLILSSIPSFRISTLYGLYSLILGGPILFTTVLIHEMGHAIAALKLGGEVRQILLWPLGGLAYISFFGETNPKADAIIAIAGPLTHFPQIAVWILLMYLTNGGDVELRWQLSWGYDFWLSLCAGAIALQITLFCFNLIPAYPLDGGRLFGALLAHLHVDRNLSFQATALLGSFFGWYFLYSALDAAASTDAASDAFFSGWNQMFIALFILYNCYQLWVLGSSGAAASHPGYNPASSSSYSSSAPTTAPAWMPSIPNRTLYAASASSSAAPTSSVVHRLGDADAGTEVAATRAMRWSSDENRGKQPHSKSASVMAGDGHRLGTAEEVQRLDV